MDAAQPQWRILDTGFGAGLDFLAALQAWRDNPARPRPLHYFSVVTPDARLASPLAGRLQGLTPGVHRFLFEDGRVVLTLAVGDLQAALREQEFNADAVILQGGAADLATIKAVTRLCRTGTSLQASEATAQEHLRTCGWQVEPDALRATYLPRWTVRRLPRTEQQPQHCVVVGAGLSGAAVAASLARRGWQVEVLDAAPHPAGGASSLPVGLLAPHQSPDDNLLSRLSRAGVRVTLQECALRLAAGEQWALSGALEVRGDDARALPSLPGLAPWSCEAAGSDKSAATLPQSTQAWWHANAAWVKPSALVQAWLAQPGVVFRGNTAVARIERDDAGWEVLDARGDVTARAPLVVIAAAHASAVLLGHRITTHPVRGQVSWNVGNAGALPPFPVNGHGHFVPNVPTPEGIAWFSGSTYGRQDPDGSLRTEDDAANLQRIRELLPQVGEPLAADFTGGRVRSWAGVRCASPDRRPLVGEVEPGLWVSTAMGSRGLTFAALCAELIAARLHAEPLPLPVRLAQALDVKR